MSSWWLVLLLLTLGKGVEATPVPQTLPVPTAVENGTGEATPGCPTSCHCDAELKTLRCGGQHLLDFPPDLPASVETLYLDHNLITSITNDSLADLVNLRYLMLTNNKISNVDAGAFRNLARLEQLYLNNNQLDTLKATAVHGATSLKFLDLEFNRFKRIPSLGDLTSLQTLVLQGNLGLTDPTFPRDFKYIKNLKDIVLSGGKFPRLEAGTFEALAGSNVQKLELSRSFIASVDNATFKPLASLRSLKIGYNPLDATQLANVFTGLQNSSLTSLTLANVSMGGVLPVATLALLSTTPLTTLELTNNRLRQLPDFAFAMLPTLVTLDLSQCSLDTTSPATFGNLTRLEILFLNENQLATVPAGLPSSLRRLYLNDNRFLQIPNDIFSHLKFLEELYLGNNRIHQLSEDSLHGLVALKTLHLSGNIIATLPSRLFDSLVRLETLELNNNNLQNIKPNPALFKSQAGLLALNLASNGCSYLPSLLLQPLRSLQALKLEDNVLGPQLAGDYEGLTFQGLAHLQQLFLQNNAITDLPPALFKDMAELRQVSLRRNRLSHWGPTTFQPTSKLQHLDLSENLVSVINQSSLAALTSLQALNLSSNPFQCACALCWFRQWVGNHSNILVDLKDYRCDSPPSWQGKPLLSFSCDQINCTDYTMYIVAGSVVGAFLVSCLLAYAVFYYRWYIGLRFYRLKKALFPRRQRGREGYERIPDTKFEGYVSYADDDHVWVRENVINGTKKRLCDREIDFPSGPKVKAFNRFLEEVSFAVVALTRNYKEDKWAMFELSCIIDAGLKCVVVKDGNIRDRDVPKLLRTVIERNKYVECVGAENVREHYEQRLEDAINAVNV